MGKKLKAMSGCIKDMKIPLLFTWILAACALVSCSENSTSTYIASIGLPEDSPSIVDRPDGWDGYWYSGKAEVNSYSLIQNRYGEERTGDAILVFVAQRA